MEWLAEHWPGIASLALMGGGVWWSMPRTTQRPKVVGLLLALLGAYLLASRLRGEHGPIVEAILFLAFATAAIACAILRPKEFGLMLGMLGAYLLASRLRAAEGPVGETILFFAFATAAIICAILMITNRNPVYSALWFALVTLSTCGLFWLQSAPFLAAATVIVYAGAIVVTFVFVIMLAQQSGATVYDQQSRQPFLATLAAFVVLGALLSTLKAATSEDLHVAEQQTPAAAVNAFSRPPESEGLDTMRGLGRSLFCDYLFAVELAGTLLLVATIGAIAIAPRRRQGTL